MRLFHKHQWKTTKRLSKPVYPKPEYILMFKTGEAAIPKPINHKWVVYQQCTKCGKEIIRKKS